MPLNFDVRSFYPFASMLLATVWRFDVDKKGKSYKIGRIFIQDLHSFDHSPRRERKIPKKTLTLS